MTTSPAATSREWQSRNAASGADARVAPARPGLTGASVQRIITTGSAALPATLVFIATLVVWEVAIVIFQVKEFLVPAPSKVVLQLVNPNMNWARHFWVTAWETLAGFTVAAVFGIALAYLIVHYRRLNRILYPYVLAAQLVPKVAIAPLFFIWFGFGELPKILVAFLVAFFPIVVDTIVGLQAADPDMLDFMRTLRASTYRTFLRVKLPAALPHIFGSFKVAVTLAVIGAVIGEFVGAESGLGYMIIRAQGHFRTDQVFASLFLLAVLGTILFVGFALVERLAIPWYARMKRLQSGVGLAAVLCAVAFTWSPTSVTADTTENVNFGLDWVVYGKHAMFYPAIEQGIYQKHGFAVTMTRGFGSGDTIQKVDQKAIQFGFADMGTLVLLRAKGAKVTMVGMVHHVMPHAVAFIKGGAIRAPKDLEGKSFSSPPGNAVWILLPVFARATGFDHTKMKHIPADAPAAKAAMLAGRVDTIGIFWPEYPPLAAEAKKLGKEIGTFKYSDVGLDLYSNGIIVHEDLVREKPDVVQRFVKATYEGIHWSLKNPEKAFELYMKRNADQDKDKAWGEWTTAVDLFGAVAKKAQVPLQLAWMDPDKARKTVELIGELYKLESPVKPAELYTNKFAEPLK